VHFHTKPVTMSQRRADPFAVALFTKCTQRNISENRIKGQIQTQSQYQAGVGAGSRQ